MRKHFGTAKKTADELRETRYYCAYYERNEQQESNTQHHCKRDEALTKKARHSLSWLWCNTPDCVERRLQLTNHACRPKHQSENPNSRRNQSRFGLATRALDHPLNGFCALLPHDSLNCSNNLLLCRCTAEGEAGNRDDDDQQRRQ